MRKILELMTIGTLTTLMAVAGAHAQENFETSEAAGGDVRAPSPRIMNPEEPGYFLLGAGPSVGFGMNNDRVLYNVMGAYNRNLSDRVAAKIMGDLHFGAETDTSRYGTVALGADIFLNEVLLNYGVPYITGNVGYGFVRNNADNTAEGVTLGLGTGFKFAAESMNVDVNLHYSILTAQLDGSNPSVLGLRAGINF